MARPRCGRAFLFARAAARNLRQAFGSGTDPVREPTGLLELCVVTGSGLGNIIHHIDVAIAKTPYEFRYQSVHYIVRSRGDQKLDGQNITAGTPCEVQIRTLLQHAHSELTHDTIYKPSVKGTPAMLRAAAKSMALIESTNDYFEELVKEINAEVAANRQLSDELADIYRATVGKSADPTRAEGLLNDAFATFAGEKPLNRLTAFLTEKPYIPNKIAARSAYKHLFRQPSILLAYLAASTDPIAAVRAWPLTLDEIKPIFSDLGAALPQG
nr:MULTISPECIES: hypothetical protein [unclassified Bradyrhizobium]